MKKLLAILSLLTISTGLLAQLTVGDSEIGVTFTGGVSRVYNEYDPSFYRPSANLGIYHRFKLSKNTFVGIEFSLHQIEGKQEYDERIWDTHQWTENTYYYLSHSTYVGFSPMIGCDIFKFSIDIKAQLLYLMINKGEEVDKKKYNGTAIVDDDNTYNDFLDTKLDFGLRFGLNYQITRRIIISSNYYYSFTEVHSYVGEQMRGKITQITLGVKYSLWTSN